MLGLAPADVGRFRDCFVANGEIAIYTRNGGGNRPDYWEVFEKLSRHPSYLRDEDDEFDSTYATIYFSFPKEFTDVLSKLDGGEHFDPDKKWLGRLAEIQQMSAEELKARFPELVQVVGKIAELRTETTS